MRETVKGHGSKIVDVARKYQKSLGITAGLVVAYTLAGFFLAPWLVKRNAVAAVQEIYGSELRLEKVVVNPYILSLRVDGLAIDDPGGEPFARVAQIYVNFQLSSLLRWAWTFDEFRLDRPELFVSRDAGGKLNLAFLLDASSGDAAPTGETAEDATPPRLLIFDLAVNESVVHWDDAVPLEPVSTRFGPVNVAVSRFNTLPDQSGQQDVVITTETEGTLGWSGSLQLNPLQSTGHASIKGSHFPLTSAYIRYQAGYEVVDGLADVEFDYRFAAREDGSLGAGVDNLSVDLRNVHVRTFHNPDNDPSLPKDRQVLELPGMHLAGGSVRWPERTVSLVSFAFDDARVDLYRAADGRLNIMPSESTAEGGGTPPADSSDTGGGAVGWHFSLDRFNVNRLAFGLVDDSVQPQADIGIRSLDLEIVNLSNEPGTAFPTSLQILAREAGTVTLNGTVVALPAPALDFDIGIDALALASGQPYIEALADVSLDSGALNLTGHLASTRDEPLKLEGDVSIVDFLVTETDQGSALGSWESMDLHKLALSFGARTLDIAEIRFDRPYGDIVIAEDGTVNLGRVQKGDRDGDAAGQDADAPPPAAPGATNENAGMAVTIGRVLVASASADFIDRSLPLPFDARIAELNGEMSTIATASVEPSQVTMEGQVDEYGLVRISGTVTPLDPALSTDLRILFRNVEMPKFSAYSIPFAGREIASGKLDLDLGYTVNDSELVGENSVVLRDFELGNKVEHPGALSLPLGLAVALLKDRDGKIDIDLPVRGNVDDPEFRYGGVVVKALVNLVTKIITSPFALLANLVGVEANELEYVNFPAGRADMTPPELERAGKIAEALTLRPELLLEIRGVVDREADGLALRTREVDRLVEERFAAEAAAEVGEAINAAQRTKAVEALYLEGSDADSTTTLDELRLRFMTISPAGGNEPPAETFDQLAYTAELRRQLIDRQTVDEQEFVTLAGDRAANARAAILASDPLLDPRIVIGQPKAVDAEAGESIPMQVTLTTGESVARTTADAQ